MVAWFFGVAQVEKRFAATHPAKLLTGSACAKTWERFDPTRTAPATATAATTMPWMRIDHTARMSDRNPGGPLAKTSGASMIEPLQRMWDPHGWAVSCLLYYSTIHDDHSMYRREAISLELPVSPVSGQQNGLSTSIFSSSMSRLSSTTAAIDVYKEMIFRYCCRRISGIIPPNWANV